MITYIVISIISIAIVTCLIIPPVKTLILVPLATVGLISLLESLWAAILRVITKSILRTKLKHLEEKYPELVQTMQEVKDSVSKMHSETDIKMKKDFVDAVEKGLRKANDITLKNNDIKLTDNSDYQSK